MLVDTHAHLNFSAFDFDRENVIDKCLKENIWMINIGTNYQTSQKALEIAERYKEGVYAAIGLHPINLETDLIKNSKLKAQSSKPQLKAQNLEDFLEKEFDYEKYKELALSSKKIVAIGEIGLDFWRRPKTKKKQEEFKKQQKDLLLEEIKLAQELNLPMIFHCRLGHSDLIEIINKTIEQFNNITIRAVIHSFTGTWHEAKKFLDLGFYFGFNGIIYKLDLNEVIKNTPLDRILIETDCPYLTPPEFPEERNNPLGVKFIAEQIAKIKNETLEKIAESTFQNTKNLFKI